MGYLESVYKFSLSVMHAGLEKPALACPVLDTGDSIRGHPPTKVKNHLEDWVPVFTGNPGFLMEFIPMKIGAGLTPSYMKTVVYGQTLFRVCL